MKLIAIAITAFLGVTSNGIVAQETPNTAGKMMEDEKRLTLGGYGQIDYNQPLEGGSFQNGNLDVHRLVLLFGYKFNEKTQFITELEFEHVKEIYVEQAFLQYEITSWLKFRGGLMLVPMGIINEYHEPSTFNGVERPNLDKYVVPSTWREIGAGFTGVFPSASISYQAYVMNGFNGYDGNPNLSGADGFRKGRQQGAESIITSPSFAFKMGYFGVKGLQLGFSGYSGKTQSTLYHGLDKSDAVAISVADSSIVRLSMTGVDARYNLGGFYAKTQVNYGVVANSDQYNEFTGSDLGSAIFGWYGEVACNLFHSVQGANSELIPFVRLEQYNTHASVSEVIEINKALKRTDLTFGLGWRMVGGAMLKADYQIFRNSGSDEVKKQFNAGVAVWF